MKSPIDVSPALLGAESPGLFCTGLLAMLHLPAQSQEPCLINKQRTAASLAYVLSPPSERAFCLAKPLRHARACSHTHSSGSTGNIARAASYQGNTHKYCWLLEASPTGCNINLCASEVICRPGNPGRFYMHMPTCCAHSTQHDCPSSACPSMHMFVQLDL